MSPMSEPTAAEQLLALELAREERRKHRNRVLAWVAGVVVTLVVIAIPAVVVWQQQAADAARECRLTASMIGSDPDRC